MFRWLKRPRRKEQRKLLYQNYMALAAAEGWYYSTKYPMLNRIAEWGAVVDGYQKIDHAGAMLPASVMKVLLTINVDLRRLCTRRGPIYLFRSFDAEFRPPLGWKFYLASREALFNSDDDD